MQAVFRAPLPIFRSDSRPCRAAFRISNTSLGAELFHRTTRALSLTEAGQRFYGRAQDILAEFDEAEAEARGLDQEPVGMLRVSAPHSFRNW